MKWLRQLSLAVILGLFARGGMALGGDQLYQWEREIQLPELTETELISVTLDAPVFSAASITLADVRVIDQHNREVAFIFDRPVAKSDSTRLVYIRPRQISKRTHPDGRVEWELERYASQPRPAGLTISTMGTDFRRSLTVRCRSMNGDWTPLVTDALLVKSSQFPELDELSAVFPPHEGRQYQVEFRDLEDSQLQRLQETARRMQNAERSPEVPEKGELHLEAIDLWTVGPIAGPDVPEEAPLGQLAFHVQPAPEGRTWIDVQSRRQPILRLELETPSRNFSRTVHLFAGSSDVNPDKWRRLDDDQISHLDFKALKSKDLLVDTLPIQSDLIRLEIINRDSPPLEIQGVQGYSQVIKVVFLASHDDQLKLVYGNTEAHLPVYDLAALRSAIREGYVSKSGALGPVRQGSEVPVLPPFDLGRTLANTPALISIVVLLVGLLAFLLYRASRRMAALDLQSGSPDQPAASS